MISAVIATKDRSFTLATTLTSLLSSNIKEIIIINTGDFLLKDKSYFKALYESIKLMNKEIKIINYPTNCVAKARVKGIEESSNDYIFMCDDDDLVDPYCISNLYNSINLDFGAIACVFFEALNLPCFPDWNTYKYTSIKEFINSGNDLITMQFHLWELEIPCIELPIDHISTHALWSRNKLESSKVLDFWFSYPEKTPNYDYFGSKQLSLHSTLYFQTNSIIYHLQHFDQNRFWNHGGENVS